MPKKICVRFAPSPTGSLHIGGVRTALYNYLFAKKHGGDFILRIEDTDQKRFVNKASEYILEALEWLNIPHNKGFGKSEDGISYKQSDRLAIYKEHIQILVENGSAYYAFDKAEDLEKARKKAEAEKKAFSYDASTRGNLDNSLNLTKEQTQARINEGEPFVIRFLIEPNQELILHDEIRGQIKINSSTLDDKVLYKSDGYPTYHLANVVDDHWMEISHVIRGEEWLPSMALHVLLYEAFGWEKPVFAHLPLILKPDGKGKLSKRDAEKGGFPVLPMDWFTEEETVKGFREMGFLPEAVINFLALLGWSKGDKEIYSLDELVEEFSLENVNKAGARYNFDKAKFFNQEHIKQKANEFFLPQLENWAKSQNIEKEKKFHLIVIELMKPRMVFANDLWEEGEFFYKQPNSYPEKALAKAIKPNTKDLLLGFSTKLQSLDNFDKVFVKSALENYVLEKEVGFGQLMLPLRLALSGKDSGPDLFEIFELLGLEESLSRINYFLKKH